MPYEQRIIDGIHYHWIKTKPYKPGGLRQIWNQMQFVVGCWKHRASIEALKPDVVIASSPHPFVILPAAALARTLDVPLIYEARDLWPQILIELGGFSRWHPYVIFLALAEKYAVRHSHMIISVKKGDFDYFSEKYGLLKSRFRYLPNGFLPEAVESKSVPETYHALRKRYHFLIVYVGAISAYYKLDKLLMLANRLRHVDSIGIVVVGSGDYSEALEAQAKKGKLSNFHLTGPVSRSVVPSILELADACYVGIADLPVNRYGISCNKIYEYMYAAKPIIGHYHAGYDPVHMAGCGVTASEGNEDILVNVIQDWLNNPELAKGLGRRGREYFDKHHDFRKVALNLHREMSALKENTS
jgi:glycosyltransferase involved in cell wall biosynthesis